MEGGKKTAKKLTPEEWLEQALVPAEEQPYVVPENWCWCRIAVVCDFERGITFPASAKKYESTGNDIPCLRTANVQEKLEIDDLIYVDKSYMKNNKAKYIYPEDIIMSSANSKELVGKTSYVYNVPFPMTFGGFVLTLRAKNILSKYLFCYLRLEFLSGKFMGESTQTTNIANINTKKLGYYEIPLPPFAEQKRIVDYIERLFGKLEEAREKVQAVLDGFELRRSAVLHKAFSGELTERWRQEHGVVLESWKRFSISSVCNSLKYGTAKKSEKTGSVVVIRMGNLQRGEIDWSDLAYSNDKDDIEKYHLDAGDVLFNRTNSAALVGKTSIYRGEYPAIYAGYLIKLDYKHDIITGEFLNYALNTNHAKEYCNSVKTDGVNQSNINAKKIGAYIIPVPTIDEQVKIVECLQNLLKKEQQAQKAAESVIDQIDIIKKAILSRAFRGELGTNDPKEENAKNLLLKMFKEKDNVEHKIKPAAKDKTDTKTVHNFKSSLEETIYQFILNHPECTLSEMKSLSGNFSDINKALLHLKQNKKVQISNSKYRVMLQDENPISSIQ